MKTDYLTDTEINIMATAVLAALDVSPLSHSRQCEIARDTAWDDFEKRASRGAVLVAVKRAQAGWQGVKQGVQRALSDGMTQDELTVALIRSTAQQALTQTRSTMEEDGVRLFSQLLIDKVGA